MQQRMSLPIQPPAFAGKIGPIAAESRPDWVPEVRAPAGAPNVVVILTDDVGFAASSTFGGPVPTPNLDRLARQGLRYNEFHTTGVCSPTRAALLTGRNHHAVSVGLMADLPSGFPGYSIEMPPSAATVARVLTLNGYNTAMFGKHHIVAPWEASAAGPFDRWPLGLGFEYFYGFVGGDADQYSPTLIRGQSPAQESPAEKGKLLDVRLTDDAIRWVHNQNAADPDKPFFVYFAPGSTHAPHQAPPEWIARFKGKFDQGWDKLREETYARQLKSGVIPRNANLTPRAQEIPAWNALSNDEKRAYARMMEVYAAQLSFQDEQIGRLLNEIDRMGLGDNTLVMFIEGDNGASAEAGNVGMLNEVGRIANNVQDTPGWLAQNIDAMGGPKTYENYPAGWAWAMNTPFQWTKQVASHLGGTRNGLVVRWPARIRQGGQSRSEFGHVIDIMPSILDAAGVPQPATVNGIAQQRVDGISLLPGFAASRHTVRTQYFELAGNRAIYSNGWMANTRPLRMPWEDKPAPGKPTTYSWELYDLERDYSQSTDLAAKMPGKLQEMKDLFDREARANNVYPIDDRFAFLRGLDAAKAHPPRRNSFDYWGSDTSVMLGAAPQLPGHSFTLTADLTLDSANADGVLASYGSWFGGWAFYLKNGVPVALQAVSTDPADIFRITGTTAVPAGRHQVKFDFSADAGFRSGGTVRMWIDGVHAGEGRISRTIARVAGLGETFDIGHDAGVPVSEDYNPAGDLRDAIGKINVTIR